jgi:hypothetical protein
MGRFSDHEVVPRFWELIDASKGDESAMRATLMNLSRDDIIRFDAEFGDAVSDLLYRVLGDHGDVYEEEEIAGWVVSQGSAYYAVVWDHPDQFPTEIPDAPPNFYGLAGVVGDERFRDQPITSHEQYAVTYWPKARGSSLFAPELPSPPDR